MIIYYDPSAVTEIDATSAAAPVTLADGSNGQLKIILNVSTSGTNAITITPSNLRGGTTITLNAPGETVTLKFSHTAPAEDFLTGASLGLLHMHPQRRISLATSCHSR